MENRLLNVEFVVEDNDKVVSIIKSIKDATSFNEILTGKGWEQTVARAAEKGGLPLTFEEAEQKVAELEKDIRMKMAIPSARPGGARSKGTGFKLDPTFKSYKSTIKGAFETGEELLDANGVPRSRNDVSDDIKDARAGGKSDNEKLDGATTTWLALFAKCPDDPVTKATVKRIVDALYDRGYTTETVVLAA